VIIIEEVPESSPFILSSGSKEIVQHNGRLRCEESTKYPVLPGETETVIGMCLSKASKKHLDHWDGIRRAQARLDHLL
jgi:hypothetical protein